MSTSAKRWAILYAILLLALAGIGASNRQLYRLQQNLIDQKEALQTSLINLRPLADAVKHSERITAIAYARGMVPTSLLTSVHMVPPSPAPKIQEPLPSRLEIRTVWLR
jgi:hypothetical protein